jgi:hypothetical protein
MLLTSDVVLHYQIPFCADAMRSARISQSQSVNSPKTGARTSYHDMTVPPEDNSPYASPLTFNPLCERISGSPYPFRYSTRFSFHGSIGKIPTGLKPTEIVRCSHSYRVLIVLEQLELEGRQQTEKGRIQFSIELFTGYNQRSRPRPVESLALDHLVCR